ncbi:MAG: hypothetical protein CFE39_11980 [Comamonadaceae bacterium PBBC2]|nr:MAG: hypothetical protein CFE39_11980 [Comamonadaceae bacterium PBBC2]
MVLQTLCLVSLCPIPLLLNLLLLLSLISRLLLLINLLQMKHWLLLLMPFGKLPPLLIVLLPAGRKLAQLLLPMLRLGVLLIRLRFLLSPIWLSLWLVTLLTLHLSLTPLQALALPLALALALALALVLLRGYVAWPLCLLVVLLWIRLVCLQRLKVWRIHQRRLQTRLGLLIHV